MHNLGLESYPDSNERYDGELECVYKFSIGIFFIADFN
jgi:hypothetical protein